MPTTLYPSRFERKTLAVEAPGGPPTRLTLVMPTVTAPGAAFPVRIAALDGCGYPSMELQGAVRVDLEGEPLGEISFEHGEPAVGVMGDVTLPTEGLFRLSADIDGRTCFSNPTHCSRDPEDGIYWGDPHIHTVLSNCYADRCRSLNCCYVAARWLTGFDWASAADHVSNGRSSLGQWREQMAVADAFDDPPAFVTLPSYEASLQGGAGGDTNVYMRRWPEMFVDEYEEGNARTLCDRLAEVLAPGDFFVVPHHTTRIGKHGEIGDDIYPGPERMPVVEIHSKWGTSEYRGNPNPLLKVHPGPSYVQDLLARGLTLGFIAGTDTHVTLSAVEREDPEHIPHFPGHTAVYTPRLSRAGVFNAIRARRCYGTSLERIYLQGTIGGRPFGSIASWTDAARGREIAVTVAGQSDIDKVEIIRNGECVHRVAGDAWQAHVTWCDEASLNALRLPSPHIGPFVYYYVRVTCMSGAQAWSSPVWLTR